MSSPWIQALRSVTLAVPDLGAAVSFYTRVWQLEVAARTEGAVYLRGSGSDHHLLALHCGRGTPRLLQVTLRARTAEALAAVAQAAHAAGGQVTEPGPADDPAGGTALQVRDPQGRVFVVVHGDRPSDRSEAPPADMPRRLSHLVFNSRAATATQAFIERAFGFALIDRTRSLAFLNCDRDHHTLAVADADNDALNHVAFELPTLDAVMRGAGRLRDAGLPCEWGPGRHGPGDNAFTYFVDPFGVPIEYTAELLQIDDSYRAGGPADWAWPPGRVDQWGLSAPPSPRLRLAQRRVACTGTALTPDPEDPHGTLPCASPPSSPAANRAWALSPTTTP